MKKNYFLLAVGILLLTGLSGVTADEDEDIKTVTVEPDLGSSREALRTDDEAVKREEEAIKLDGLNVAQFKQLREKAEKFTFQAEVNRMMKLIINSLYKNKEIFLRELISNASDALDKIRLLSLTDPSALSSTPDLAIKIKLDPDNKVLHVIDTGIGMTKNDLINNLGTIAKSGTAEFLTKMQEDSDSQDTNDMIGQFGVGFYSAFLVADNVVVTSKNNNDDQYIWESDTSSFNIAQDPRGNTLPRGTQISLQLKPEASDYLQPETIRNLVKKYSQFINFPIYLWASKTITEEEPIEEEATKEEKDIADDEDGKVEEEDAKEEKPKTKKVEKTVWDWEKLNEAKPIWTRKPTEIEEEEYNAFYKTLTKDTKDPLTKVHFVAEGEVTFKSLLFVPETQPGEGFNRYGTKTDHIKLFVRRVFISDDLQDMMPSYLSFIQGVVDSDDLPLNVSRETLQQHKLIKIIKKKLVRKALDMLKKMDKDEYEKFWKEYSTNIKLGVIEDSANRTRLAKLLMFLSSYDSALTSLADYVSRMKPNQEHIYYIAGANRDEVAKSPFVERLLKKGYEVLYLVEAVDEYCISALPEFEGKKFQNVAKEGFTLADSESDKEKKEALKTRFEPLIKWFNDDALKNHIAKATLSERLSDSPCALVASMFGWTGNMERLAVSNAHQKTDDPQRTYYLNQKKVLEVNPRHPLIKELLRRVEDDPADPTAKDMALMMFRTATLRSGYMLKDTSEFAASVEAMMRKTLGISPDEKPDEDESGEDKTDEAEEEVNTEEHDEL
ncbi:endoplasmin isoform X2 [Neocloeon triangulifer]|uniref:endoplasmin isoform X2 n=1 Tax=Neocloeon triangulifer TaxID=2078957 RepID=UPI00286EFA40|nr:endoplasmin isoform X2 [Neocloeon triangulifer]